MSDHAEKKDTIKKQVRALLISSPAPLTVDELERDFYNLIGVRLAYREIGYASVEDFVRDIDDDVTISYKNGVMVLKAKTADETRYHVVPKSSSQRNYWYSESSTLGPSPCCQCLRTRHCGGSHSIMSDHAEKKDTIKKQVRALLISSPAQLTVDELEREFYNLIGVRLAYREIGYASVEDFLRDIDDAVTISYENGVMVLKAKTADETRYHVVPKSSSQRNYWYSESSTLGPSPCCQCLRTRHCGGSHSIMSDHAEKKDTIKKQVRALLISSPAQLTVDELERDFYNLIGVRLAYREIGYASVEDFLRDMDDVVTISYKNGVMVLNAKTEY